MKKTCCIVGAGPSRVYITENAYIIAADGGIDKLKRLSVKADLIIGDFDSAVSDPRGDNVITFPIKKDDTDTLLAIKEAIKRGCGRIVISGGMGGSLDHTVANIQSLSYALDNGVEAFLTDGEQSAIIIKDSAVIKGSHGNRCSVFAYGGNAEGVTINGLEYGCEDITLTPAFPLGVSNAFAADKAEISLKKGRLLIIWQGTPEQYE